MSEPIKVILKQKFIPVLVDFCIDEKIEFSVKPQAFPDIDWEFNLMVADVKTAVLTGMFLKENRIDMAGMEQPRQKKAVMRKVRDEEEKAGVQAEEAKPDENQEKGLF